MVVDGIDWMEVGAKNIDVMSHQSSTIFHKYYYTWPSIFGIFRACGQLLCDLMLIPKIGDAESPHKADLLI